MTEARRLSAAELSRGYAERRFSPVEITQDFLRAARRSQETLNAFYILDEDGALASAAAAADRWSRGAPLDPLDGVPTSIKDALPSVGQPSYRGSAAHNADRQVFATDAPCVARMREAGMVFLGKTTMPDFGILASGYSSKHGVTRNPVNLDRTPGGSSSGAAATVAAGINPVAVGTDIVGSIRLPASFCGIYGMKPSQGRVPYYFPNSPSLVAGPMARDVSDAALLMNVIARPDARDHTALPFSPTDYVAACRMPLAGARVGLVLELGEGLTADPDVTIAVRAVADRLRRSGFAVEERGPRFSRDDLDAAELFYQVRCRTEFAAMPADRHADASVIASWSQPADVASAVDVYRAFNRLQQMRERTIRLMDGIDFLLLPTVPKAAFAAELVGYDEGSAFAPWINTYLFNVSEQPASSVPCGWSSDGLPIGAQIVGQRFDDAGVFAMSRIVENLVPQTLVLDTRLTI